MTRSGREEVKYLSISGEIASRIRRGILVPGDRIPSENDIISSYGVSNTTARKALLQLEISGLARRVKGRGTYVLEKQVFRPAAEILSFSENMRRAGMRPSTRVISITCRKAGIEVCVGESVVRLHGPCYEVRRLRFGDEVPMMRETRYIDTGSCPGLETRDLSGSLYELYAGYGVKLTEVRQSLRPVILTADESSVFGLPEPASGMVLEGASRDPSGRVVELEYSVYRGDRYRFIVSASNET